MENNKRMSFEADAGSIDIKQLLQKDFLELSMRVISDANPNVNMSWFTPESMENSLDTFVNKPILGYFENGDFVSHDGEWNYDSETQMDYWDTLGRKGERILGMIRESDGVEIVEGNDGLKWIELKCCLWVQYGYKQVKRLLKDAKKAKKKGSGPAKNVSVEVDILDAEKMPNGVLKINKFNLVGITILGSRNGVKVEPGIENAGLSVIDIMGKDVFEAQKNALRLAYEKIDNPNNKGEILNMEMENNDVVIKDVVENFSAEEKDAEQTVEAQAEQAEQFSNDEQTENTENTVNPEASAEGEGQAASFEDDKKECEEKEECAKETCEDDKKEDDKDEDDDDDKDEDDAEEGKEDNCKYEGQAEAEAEEEVCPGCASHVVYDLTYLLERMSGFTTDLAYTVKYYQDFEVKQDAIIAFLERIKRQSAEDIAVLGQLISDATEEFKNAVLNFEKDICEDTMSSLYKKFESEKEKNANYSEKIEEIKKNEYLQSAKEMIDLAELKEEDSKAMYEACESGEIADIDVLKNKIALKLFEERISNNKNKVVVEEDTAKKEDTVVSFSAPVNEPVVNVEEQKAKKKGSAWDTLKEYNKN